MRCVKPRRVDCVLLPGLSSGAVYVFARSGTTWSQQAYVKASKRSVAQA